jgi:toxin ParE1/3/4
VRLVLSSEALDDLEDIYDYSLVTWDVTQAERYLSQLFEVLDSLLGFPELGRPLPGPARATRVLRVGQHNAFYRIEEVQVRVLRLAHVRRNVLPELL